MFVDMPVFAASALVDESVFNDIEPILIDFICLVPIDAREIYSMDASSTIANVPKTSASKSYFRGRSLPGVSEIVRSPFSGG